MTFTLPAILFIVAFIVVLFITWREFSKTSRISAPTIALLLITIGLVLLSLGILSDPLIRG